MIRQQVNRKRPRDEVQQETYSQSPGNSSGDESLPCERVDLSTSGESASEERLECDDELLDMLSVLYPPRKQRIRNRKRNLAPKVLKLDVRRQYGQMLINILNSSDQHIVQSFFKTYASPCIIMEKQCRCQRLHAKPTITVQGISQLSQYWLTIMAIAPDSAFFIDTAQILTRADTNECRVVCRVRVDYTNIYDVAVPTIAFQTIQNNNSRNAGHQSQDLAKSITAQPNYIVPYDSLERCEPWRAQISFTLTIGINEWKQISRLDCHQCSSP